MAFEKRIPTEHDTECMCPLCLLLDMDQTLAAQGVDPGRYRDGIPDRVWRQFTPADLAELADAAEVPPPVAGPDGGDAATVPPQPSGSVVTVLVADTGAGVWARFTGATADGETVTVSGGVVGGPDRTPDGWCVKVRDYCGNPDVVLFVPDDGVAELVDDPAEHAARAAYAVAPEFGPVVEMEFARRVVPPPRKKRRGETSAPRRGRWVRGESRTGVTVDQLKLWEDRPVQDDAMVSAVHRGHVPVVDNPPPPAL